MKKVLLSLALIFASKEAFSLKVDRTRVARVLSVSDSKKTILVNRGTDDGLKVGDHGKISSPEGVIAHGELNQVSPMRSVWSLYKILQREKIVNKIVVTIKIIPPIKLTQDETRNYDFFAEEKKAKTPKKSVQNKKRVVVQQDNVDYSSLNDSGHPIPRDPDIDWSEVQDTSKHKRAETELDLSNLY